MSNKKPLLEWTSYPLFDFLISGILVIIFSLTLSIWIFDLTINKWESPLYFYLGMLIYFGSLITFFIPTKYQFFDDKIVVTYFVVKIERIYADFGCFYADKKGVMLSTFKQPRRLDPFRGLSIRFSKKQNEKDALLNLLENKIGNQY